MVWSLSKDDDGLEPVYPLSNQGAAVPSVAGGASAGAPSQEARARRPASSVLVDPNSQVPEAHSRLLDRAHSGVARRAHSGLPHSTHSALLHSDVAEPTLVLKGRKLDEMRAEVARRKAVHRRRKQNNLILWAAAGGAALALGWFAGIALSPPDLSETPAGDVPGPAAAKAVEAQGSEEEETSDGSGEEGETRLAESEVGAILEAPSITHLEDIPKDETEGELTNEEEAANSGNEKPEDEVSDTTPPAPEATFTLDDLPPD